MSARKDGLHSERVRQRIRVSQLVTRMQNHALSRNGVEMTQSQLDSAKFLVGKAMSNPPERKELTGLDGGAMSIAIAVEYLSPKLLDYVSDTNSTT
jgi:hypothetical protein